MVTSGSTIIGIAPQFLVDDLDRSIAYYRDQLGFEVDFVYDSFYASVSRDGVHEIRTLPLSSRKAPPADPEKRSVDP